jgi:homoserine O-succinyltransferase
MTGTGISGRPKVAIGLVNNMPDGALDQTERQFVSLLTAASADIDLCLGLFAMPDVPRGELGAGIIDEKYLSVHQLWDMKLDALIVTGREPLSPRLEEEPYWDLFTQLFNWAQERTYSTVWSCLAAHAAVLYRDGIGRVRRDSKASGIFDCVQVGKHDLLQGIPQTFHLPHSRWNTLSEAALRDRGYTLLSHTGTGDIDTFILQDKSLFLYFQGHPEYEAYTLLLEYRRDIGRYCRGESSVYPSIPVNYFEPALAARLAALQQAANGHGLKHHLEQANALLETATVQNDWLSTAVQFYKNWLQLILQQKGEKLTERSPLHFIALNV